MIKPDTWIRKMAKEQQLLEPFVDPPVREGVISYGLSSYGYDLQLHPDVQIFRVLVKNTPQTQLALPGHHQLQQQLEKLQQPQALAIDPKNIHEKRMADFHISEQGMYLPGNAVVLGRSVEYIKMPDNVLAFAYGKSTLARVGLVVNICPIEPGWEGHLTIEISNTNDVPVVLYAEGIAQIVFHETSGPCETTYRDKGGKYQAQTGVTVAKVE